VLWDAASGKVLRSPVEHAGTVEGVAASAGGKLLATAGSEGKVRLWDASLGKELASLELDAPAWSVALDPDGRYLAAGDRGGAVKVWEVTRLLRRKAER
jgi:WD40 repeat protein